MTVTRTLTDGFALLPGELPMLTAVVLAPADDVLKRVYADWLDDHADPRGPYLRACVEAAERGEPLPDGGAFSAAWREVTGVRLLGKLVEHGRARHRAVILPLAKPALAIEVEQADEAEIPVGATKFGGWPDLPAGSAWPTCDRGPLEFLAQLDLSEIHSTFAGHDLPVSGLLSFFLFHNISEDEYGDGRDDPPSHCGGIRIVHTPDSSILERVGPPDDFDEDFGPPGRPCRVAYTEVLDLPADAVRFGLGNEDRTPAVEASHQLFGYGHAFHVGGDPNPGPGWRQLIRFSSDDALRWGWGDGHRLFWYIRAADLARGDFSNTFVTDG